MATAAYERPSEVSALLIREDMDDAYARAWRYVASPGTWLTGVERVTIAAEARAAKDCALCREQKAALSPFAVAGEHDGLGELPDEVVEVIHRVRADPGRLTEAWFRRVMDSGLADTSYVEIVSVTGTIMALDALARGLGIPARALPEPLPGEPTRRRTAGAKPGLCWLPTVAPEDIAQDDPNPYETNLALNIHRAFSLVPAEVLACFDYTEVFYLHDPEIRDFSREYRAIDHARSSCCPPGSPPSTSAFTEPPAMRGCSVRAASWWVTITTFAPSRRARRPTAISARRTSYSPLPMPSSSTSMRRSTPRGRL